MMKLFLIVAMVLIPLGGHAQGLPTLTPLYDGAAVGFDITFTESVQGAQPLATCTLKVDLMGDGAVAQMRSLAVLTPEGGNVRAALGFQFPMSEAQAATVSELNSEVFCTSVTGARSETLTHSQPVRVLFPPETAPGLPSDFLVVAQPG